MALPGCPEAFVSRLRLKCDGTRAETRFRLSAKRTCPFKSAGGRVQFSRLLAAEACASAVVMLDTPCSEVVWRVLATHSIRQFPLHFPFRASPCDITLQVESHWLVPIFSHMKAVHSLTFCFVRDTFFSLPYSLLSNSNPYLQPVHSLTPPLLQIQFNTILPWMTFKGP